MGEKTPSCTRKANPGAFRNPNSADFCRSRILGTGSAKVIYFIVAKYETAIFEGKNGRQVVDFTLVNPWPKKQTQSTRRTSDLAMRCGQGGADGELLLVLQHDLQSVHQKSHAHH